MRSLHREDRLSEPEIARRMSQHKSWVWRRLMLVESLDPIVQADVRLGLIAPRAAVACCRARLGGRRACTTITFEGAAEPGGSQSMSDHPSDPRVPGTHKAFIAPFPALGKAHERVAIKSHARRAIAHGATEARIEQAVLLGMNTCSFPRTVAAWSWVRHKFARTTWHVATREDRP